MILTFYLGATLLFFILAFATKNLKTYLATKQSIKGKSLKLTMSILVSTLIYLLIFLRLTVLSPSWILELGLAGFSAIKTFGVILVSFGFAMGILALIAMKNSWRVGIKYDQKTELVTTGIYRVSRNPYFFSYNILIFGYICIFPSAIIFILYAILVGVFHHMILEEEAYLESVHGDAYTNYKRKVNRYFSFKLF
ncbi:isoprenylcysteine carboxylmethyltransferase family protein [Flammeovirgaceae bacterium SG7u.111]|nr:isoprenylcysteine carboxylmethyltransferase family protein [Flammeovirgaceae bacterium SG7u.132]WPO38316.1 isoprenylcysteine carboxylmethyltransferase family protein [Flammeovirgaceae bacterium SG7u.111]